MIDLQKFIDELEAEKQKADKLAKFWEGHERSRQEYYIGMSDSLLFTVTKARLLLKKTREQQP